RQPHSREELGSSPSRRLPHPGWHRRRGTYQLFLITFGWFRPKCFRRATVVLSSCVFINFLRGNLALRRWLSPSPFSSPPFSSSSRSLYCSEEHPVRLFLTASCDELPEEISPCQIDEFVAAPAEHRLEHEEAEALHLL